MKRFAAIVLLALAGCGGGERVAPQAAPEISIDRDDIEITSSVKVKPGRYRVADLNGDGVLHIKADGITVDLTGVTLAGAGEQALPDTFEGIAVRAEGRKDVTVKGGTFRGYRGGVYLKDCAGCAVEGCDVSGNRAQRLKSTPSRCDDGADWLGPHFNDGNEWWTNYGAGIYLDGCTMISVSGCRGRGTQNGIALRNTNDSWIFDNDMSWMSGWGISMWRSSRNEISHNRCDYGVRGYSSGVYDRGQDSAGILMFEQCSGNVVAYNSATHGGDGIFIYAGHETTQRTGAGGCNGNLLYRNDFSHAVANAIECTFSDGNRFVENVLDDSNYGVWAGYSYNTTITGNHCAGERVAGVAIEHGHDNTLSGNLFEKCATGVELWWNDNPDFLKGPYGRNQNCKSEKYDVSLNRFRQCPLAFRLDTTRDANIQSNEFDLCGRLVDLAGKCPEFQFSFNRILGTSPGWFRNDTGAKLEIGPCPWVDERPRPADDLTVALGPEELTLNLESWRSEPEPALRGKLDTKLPAGVKQGMATIVVDEWGPCDPAVLKLFPSRQSAWESAEVFLFGPADGIGLRVVGAAGNLKDRTIVITPTEVSRSGAYPFRVQVHTGDGRDLTADGILLVADWNVRFWGWKAGDGEHGDYETKLDERGWAKLMQQRPVARTTTRSLRTPWADQPIPHDHFATSASTTMNFPAGNWKFTTTSDDGVRLFVDGKKVIDNWTWHAPADDSATVLLESGAHEILVEHFEIDGAEALDLAIEPAE